MKRALVCSLSKVIGIAVFCLWASGCEGQPSAEPSRGLVILNVSSYQDYVYASGSYRYSFSTVGTPSAEQMLTVFDASNPASPVLVETRDVGMDQNFLVVSDKLLAASWGYALDGTPQDMSVGVYGLGDPSNPMEEKRISIPGTAGGVVSEFKQVGPDAMLLSINGDFDSSVSDVTFIIKYANVAGTEVTGSSMRGCRKAVGAGDHVYCFSGVGAGSGVITTFALSAAGALTEVSHLPSSDLLFIQDAQALSTNTILVTDQYAGLLVYGVSAGAITGVTHLTADVPDNDFLMSSIQGPGASLLSIRLDSIRTYHATSGEIISSLPYPGGNAPSSVGGVQVRPLGGGNYVAAMGDYGILFVSVDGSGTLTKLGGYFRSWFKTGNLFDTEDFLEGSY